MATVIYILQERMTIATAIVKKFAPNSAFIPPSDHPDIIAGQGTVAMELLEQVLGWLKRDNY